MSSLLALASYLEFRSRRFRSRETLEQWQEKRVRRHLRFVSRHSPWFRNVALQQPIEAWRNWPINTKRTMLDHLAEWCTVRIDTDEAWRVAEAAMRSRDFSPMLPGGVSVGMSSGTSGSPGLFLATESERSSWAGAILARALPGTLFARHWRLALFLRANNNLYQATRGRRVRFEFFDLAGEVERHWDKLSKFAPHVLAAPPRVLVRLAEAKRAGDVRLSPERILSVAEVLEPWMKERIERSFGVRCDQIYQATEGFLGITCAEGRLHLNEDIVAVQREPVASDESVFRPIITDFRRRTQPVIRYRMEDVLRAAGEPCTCGSPFIVIEEVVGRSDELCLMIASNGESREVLPDFLRLAAAKILGRDFRIVNRAAGMLRIEANGVTSSELEKLTQELAQACLLSGCRAPGIELAPLPRLPWNEKLRRVIRQFNTGV